MAKLPFVKFYLGRVSCLKHSGTIINNEEGIVMFLSLKEKPRAKKIFRSIEKQGTETYLKGITVNRASNYLNKGSLEMHERSL